MAARLKERYEQEIRPALIKEFGYSSPMQAPKIEKIIVNMGVGEAKTDSKALEAASEQLATITGQHPNVRRAKKSIAQFKLREGMAVGVAVTLRGDRLYEFLDRLMSVAIPRIRDFRGLTPKSFDGRGNYALGIREQIIFPEIDYDTVDAVRGLDVVMTTSAKTDEEALALLKAFGMPFAAKPEKTEAPKEEPPASEPEGEAGDSTPGEADGGADEPTTADEAPQEGDEGASDEPEAAGDGDAGDETETDGSGDDAAPEDPEEQD